MNFSVHLDDKTVARLSEAVKRLGLTRNRIIARAVQEWLDRNTARDWPEALQKHFRNPAPELAEEVLDLERWSAALSQDQSVRW